MKEFKLKDYDKIEIMIDSDGDWHLDFDEDGQGFCQSLIFSREEIRKVIESLGYKKTLKKK